jgi:hypothetical protein
MDGDSSKDVQDEGSTEKEELEDILRWPPKMLIAPEGLRQRSRRRKHDTAATSTSAGQDAGGSMSRGMRGNRLAKVGEGGAGWGEAYGAWAGDRARERGSGPCFTAGSSGGERV